MIEVGKCESFLLCGDTGSRKPVSDCPANQVDEKEFKYFIAFKTGVAGVVSEDNTRVYYCWVGDYNEFRNRLDVTDHRSNDSMPKTALVEYVLNSIVDISMTMQTFQSKQYQQNWNSHFKGFGRNK